mmetsp:Transcript_2009/g.3211  ORF Transcript_2009/g.3211 Transcript_2009/m.3211 type:complete len:105 (-) Transcript_2009:31-345(-)
MLRRAARFFTQKFPNEFPEDTEALRRMIVQRAKTCGMLEAEFILLEWGKDHLPEMNRDQLIQFHQEVLNQETPDLYSIMIGKTPNPGGYYLTQLVDFVSERRNA